MNDTTTIKVWDPLVRVGHWTLVAAFILAYLSAEEWLDLHVAAGYVVLGYVLLRVVWGFIGTRHARFSDFVFRPATVIHYLKDELRLRAPRYVGHNPAGGAMVIALLISLLFTTVSGLALYGADEVAGPLAPYFGGLSHYWTEVIEEVHEFFANLTVLLVILHVSGVVVASLQHDENLIRAMITGRKST